MRFLKYFLFFLILTINASAFGQGNNFIVSIENENFSADSTKFYFDCKISNTGDINFGVAALQLVYSIDANFIKTGSTTSIRAIQSDFLPDFVTVPRTAQIILFNAYNRYLIYDNYYINSDVQTITAGKNFLIVKYELSSTNGFNAKTFPNLRFKFFENSTNQYSFSYTQIQNEHFNPFFGYSSLNQPYYFNLNLGISPAQTPKAPTLNLTENHLQASFDIINKNNGYFTGNYDSSATILGYVINLYNNNNVLIKTYSTNSSPFQLNNVPTGSYYIRYASINQADTSWFSSPSNSLNYTNNFYEITGISIPNGVGNFSPSSNVEVLPNNSQTVSFNSSRIDYELDSVFIDGNYNSSAINGTYTFNNVTANHTIKTKYKVKEISIRLRSIGLGIIDYNGTQVHFNSSNTFNIPYGTKAQLRFIPDAGQFVNQIKVFDANGNYRFSVYDSTNSYTFTVTEGERIEVHFGSEYTINAFVTSGQESGTVSPTTINLSSGSSSSFVLTPSNCYSLSYLSYLGNSINLNQVVNNVFTISNVTKSGEIAIVYSPLPAEKPQISRQPINYYGFVGQTASFSVQAITNDCGTLTYQWFKKDGNVYNPLSGETSSTLSVPIININQDLSVYRVVVYNTWVNAANVNSTTSADVMLNVFNEPHAPRITNQPKGGSINVIINGVNQSFLFNLTAVLDNFPGTLSYQWEFRCDNSSDWKIFNSSQSSTSSLNYVPATAGGFYGSCAGYYFTDPINLHFRCIVTNTLGGKTSSTISDEVTLVVNKDLEDNSTQQFVAGGLIAGAGFTVAGVVGGIGAYMIIHDGLLAFLGEAAKYIIGITIVTGTIGVIAGVATVVEGVNENNSIRNTGNPIIQTEPSNQFVHLGEDVSFSVVADLNANEGSIAYQWQSSPNDSLHFTDISASNSKQYVINNVQPANDNYYFRCRVYNSNRTNFQTYSRAVKLKIINNDSFAIITSASFGGTITPSKVVRIYENFSVDAVPLNGYKIDSIWVDGIFVGNSLDDYTYIFTNVIAAHSIYVKFIKIPKTLTINYNLPSLHLSNSQTITIPFGNKIRINFFPNDSIRKLNFLNYRINNGPKLTDSTMFYTFDSFINNTVFDIDYETILYPLDIYIVNRDLNIDSLVYHLELPKGFNYTIPVSLFNSSAFSVDSLTDNGVYKDSLFHYTLNNISTPHTINLIMSYNTYKTYITKSYDSANIDLVFYKDSFTHKINTLDSVLLTPPNQNLMLNSITVNGIIQKLNNDQYLKYYQPNSNLTIDLGYSHRQTGIFYRVVLNNTTLFDSFIQVRYRDNYRLNFQELPYFNLLHLDSVFANNNIFYNYAPDSITGFTFQDIQTLNYLDVYLSSDTPIHFISLNKKINNSIDSLNIPVIEGQSKRVSYYPPNGYYNDTVYIDNILNRDSITNYTFNNVRSNRKIEVKLAPIRPKIFYSVATLFPDGSTEIVYDTISLSYNGNYKFTYTPNPHYRVYSVNVNNSSYNYYLDSFISYTFYNITKNQYFAVVFSANSYAIYTNSNIPNAAPVYTTGFALSRDTIRLNYDMTAFKIDSMKFNSISTPIVSNALYYIIPRLDTDYYVNIYFGRRTYTINTSSNYGGNITPSREVYYDSNLTIYFTPYVGYYIDTIYITDNQGNNTTIARPSLNNYLFKNVKKSYSVKVVFKPLIVLNLAKNDKLLTSFVRLSAVYLLQTNSFLYNYPKFNLTDSNYLYPQNTNLSAVFTVPNHSHIDSLLVNNVRQTQTNDSTITSSLNLQANTFVKLFTSIDQYRIRTLADTNGRLSFTDTTVNYNSSVKLNIYPNHRYVVDSLFMNNLYVGDSNQLIINNINSNIIIRVKFRIGRFRILPSIVSGRENGTISDTMEVYAGDTLRVTYTANKGYRISQVFVGNSNRRDSSSGYTFYNIRGDSTIFTYIDYSVYKISLVYDTNKGRVIPGRDTNIHYFDFLRYKIIPNINYYLDSFIVNGRNIDTVQSTYTLLGVDTSINIRIVFDTISTKIPIFISSGPNGYLSPEGLTYVDSGANVRVKINPDSGYVLDSLTLNRNSVLDSAGYFTIKQIRDTQYLRATFRRPIYSVKTVSGPNGQISGGGNYLYNQIATITIRPDKGYIVDSLWLNGVLLSNNTYRYIDTIRRNDSFYVKFKLAKFKVSVSFNSNFGSVSPAKDTFITYFDTLRYLILANSGYFTDSITINGQLVLISDTLFLFDVLDSTLIRIQFGDAPAGKRRFLIQSNLPGNNGGNISPAVGLYYVSNDTTIIVNVTPNTGYVVDSIVSTRRKIVNSLVDTIRNIDTNYSVIVYFKYLRYNVNVVQVGTGSVSKDTSLGFNDIYRITYSPASDFSIDTILVNGVNVTSDSISGYTFRNINSTQNVRVVFVSNSVKTKTLEIKAYIQGFYKPGGSLQPVLYNSNRAGCTSCNTNKAISDSLIISLYNSLGQELFQKRVAIDTSGKIVVPLPNNLMNSSYYIVINGRNILETWSSTLQNFNLLTTRYDFTTQSSQAFGNNLYLLSDGKYGIYSGTTSSNPYTITLDNLNQINSNIANYLSGYLDTDINGDGYVTTEDALIIKRNFRSIIIVRRPY